eukprot:134271-Rhodomonas_salina.1
MEFTERIREERKGEAMRDERGEARGERADLWLPILHDPTVRRAVCSVLVSGDTTTCNMVDFSPRHGGAKAAEGGGERDQLAVERVREGFELPLELTALLLSLRSQASVVKLPT